MAIKWPSGNRHHILSRIGRMAVSSNAGVRPTVPSDSRPAFILRGSGLPHCIGGPGAEIGGRTFEDISQQSHLRTPPRAIESNRVSFLGRRSQRRPPHHPALSRRPYPWEDRRKSASGESFLPESDRKKAHQCKEGSPELPK